MSKRKSNQELVIVKRHKLFEHLKEEDEVSTIKAIDTDEQLSLYSRQLLKDVIEYYFSKRPTDITYLPNEILEHILSYLSPFSLFSVRAVSKSFYHASKTLAHLEEHLVIYPIHYLIPYFPNCVTLQFSLINNIILRKRFMKNLSESKVIETIIVVDSNFRGCLNKKPCLRDFEFPNITILEIRGNAICCPCQAIRGSKTLDNNFTSVNYIEFEHLSPVSHVPRCKILTLLKRRIFQLKHIQLGRLAFAFKDLSRVVSHIFNDLRHKNFNLKYVKLYGIVEHDLMLSIINTLPVAKVIEFSYNSLIISRLVEALARLKGLQRAIIRLYTNVHLIHEEKSQFLHVLNNIPSCLCEKLKLALFAPAPINSDIHQFYRDCKAITRKNNIDMIGYYFHNKK